MMITRPRVTMVGAFAVSVAGGFAAAIAFQGQPTEPPTTQPAPAPVRALGGWLRLLPRQVEAVTEADPQFAEQIAKLEARLQTERESLAELFEDPNALDEAIRAQVERVIATHDELERRIADYLLAIRPHLTDEQRARLFRRCAQGVREAGGWRWRHGQQGNRGITRGGGRGRGPGFGPGGRHGPGRARGETSTQPEPNDD